MQSANAASVVFVGFCIAMSIGSNALLGRGIGDTSCKYSPLYTPYRSAFGIWGPIYIMAAATVVEQATYPGNAPVAPTVSNMFYACAWLLASAWTPLFGAQQVPYLVAAAVTLCGVEGCAFIAVMTSTMWRSSSHEPSKWITGTAFSLLAGWTFVAASLNLAISLRAIRGETDSCNDRKEYYSILTAIDSQYSTPIPLMLSVAAVAAAVALPDPVLPVPVAVAVFWMRASYYNYAAFFLLGLSSALALCRAYAWM